MATNYFFIYETVDFPLHLSYKDTTITEKVLDDYQKIIVSLKQGNILLEKTEEDLGIDPENDIVNIHLTQEETGKFRPNSQAQLQINILYESAERNVSYTVPINVWDNLHKAVIEYE